jgi:amidase
MTGEPNLCFLPAREMAGRIRDGELSAREILELHLDRIAEAEQLNAVVSVDAEGARRRADQADAALARGQVWGPLHGLPMTLKDGHDVAGLRTTVGIDLLDRIADRDGAVAARLRAAGAIIVGHTNVPPWLADHQTANPIFGRTSNPWDLERTPGGSSGGAAAAVAAGLTPLEIGSDLVGSIRLPAHFCGIYGLKATEHRVPMTGFVRTPGDGMRPVRIMASLGPLARDLGDLELALSIISGPDGEDGDVGPVALALDELALETGDRRPAGGGRRAAGGDRNRRASAGRRSPDGGSGKPGSRGLAGLRLAAAPSVPGVPVAAAVRRQVERVAADAAAHGALVEERLPDLDWPAMFELFGDLLGAITGILDPGANLRDEQRGLAWYLGALSRRDRFIAAWEAFFADFDALLAPPAMTSAFPHHESGAPFEVDGQVVEYGGHGMLHAFANLTGLPGLVAPAGMDGALPVGIQIIGPRWSEMRLVAIARELEGAGVLPGFRRPGGGV